MKKAMILIILLAAFIVCSCEEVVTYGINVVNSNTFSVKVDVSTSSATPSNTITLAANGSSHVFSGLEGGAYYLHITPDPGALGAPIATKLTMKVFIDDTWVIYNDGTNYKIYNRP